MNLTCLLPDYCIGASMWARHPCGGYYMHEAWCYGPRGRIGYWIVKPLDATRSVRHHP